jgi:hypothetical protein
MKLNESLILLVAFMAMVSCKTVNITNQKNNDAAYLYQQSIGNAMSPDSAKVFTNLVDIDKQNKNLVWKQINGEDYILVVSWKQNITYYKQYKDSVFYNTGKYPIWVCTSPELQQRMKTEKYTDVNLRLKQLLGLPPTSVYSFFVEFWVKPADLFRPCPDKEINDKKCDLCFPSNTDTEHITWINQNRIERYYQCDLYNKYPWTQLGYTYDWNPQNKTHVGLSEFVIGTNKKIVVKDIYTTDEYFKLSPNH